MRVVSVKFETIEFSVLVYVAVLLLELVCFSVGTVVCYSGVSLRYF
jgi:hypothetical protein